jgi:DNA mismatch repair protein MutL
VVKRFALSEPSVGLRLSHNGKLKLRLLPVDGDLSLRLRLKKLLGHRFMASALSVDTQHDGMRLQGFISGLDYSRSQYDKQWVYLNRRMVRDKLILHAIRVAYEPLLSRGRYAVCFLHLTLSMDAVDVNVHPTKHEVRFHQPREVHDFIRLAITDAIQLAPISEPRMNLIQQHNTISWDHHLVSPVWVSLNSRYALVMDEGIAHLVDMSLVRLAMLRSHGRLTDSPWLSRPLLVPVEAVCEALDTLRAYVYELAQFGFIFSFEEPNRVLITAIPCDLPALDLHYFIHALVSTMPERESWINLLLKADAWDLTLISDQEKHDLMTYWQHHRIASRPLDEARCETFLDV